MAVQAGDARSSGTDPADPSPAVALDSLPVATVDSAPAAALDAGSEAPVLQVSSGVDFEGEEQALGFSSWVDPSGPLDPTPDELETLRHRDRRAEFLAALGFEVRPGGPRVGAPRLAFEGRWGERRRSLWGEGEAAWDAGALRGLSLRNHLQIEDEREDAQTPAAASRLSSGQELLYVRWKRALGRTGLDYLARGSIDFSWAGGDAVEGDSLAALYAFFLDYRKASAGIGLATGGASGASLHFDVASKRADSGRSGSYDAGSLEMLCGGFAQAGFWSCDMRGERRVYQDATLEEHSSSLRSFWEAQLDVDVQRLFAALEIEAALQVNATRYDPPAENDTLDAGIPGLGSLNADRLRVQADLLCAHDFFAVRDAATLLAETEAGRGRGCESLRCGAGASAERLWLDGGTGEYHALGGKAEVEIRTGEAVGEAWLQLAVLAGRRDYRGDGEGLVFDAGGLSFSFSQTDYDFLEVSLIGGGRLPGSLEWQLHAFLDRELHGAGEDDARLSSVTLALRRAWTLVRQ